MRLLSSFALTLIIAFSPIVAAQAPEGGQDPNRPREEGQGPRGEGGRRGPGGPGGPGGRGGFGRGMSPGVGIISLASNDQVKKSLGITEEQEGYLDLLRDQVRDDDEKFFGEMEGLDREQRMDKFRSYQQKRVPEIEGHLKEILGEEKFKRYKEIRLQSFGVMGLMFSEETRREVGVTESQQEEIRTEMRERFMSKMQGLGRRPTREDFDAMRKETEELVLGKLTDKQKETWNRMLGSPATDINFDEVRESMMPRRPEGGRGPGGPGGRRGGEGRGPGRNQPPAENPGPEKSEESTPKA